VAFSRTPSAALRYWNLARQRYCCCRLARYRNTLRVSADPVTKPAAHTRAESRGSRRSIADAGERRTVCWREMDSNHRSLSRGSRFILRKVNWAIDGAAKKFWRGYRWFESISLREPDCTSSIRRRNTYESHSTPSVPLMSLWERCWLSSRLNARTRCAQKSVSQGPVDYCGRLSRRKSSAAQCLDQTARPLNAIALRL
jgi:hypothetical protein